MEDSVLRAMAKWPGVADLYGWLALDRRGLWRLKGEPVTHPNSRVFINLNYQADRQGRWFFQNGPQRVFIDLAYTPWILNRSEVGRWVTHTGAPVQRISSVWLDDEGSLLLETERGIGLVKDSELVSLLEDFSDERGRPLPPETLERETAKLEAGLKSRLHLRWGKILLPVRAVSRAAVPARFCFQAHPRPKP